METHLRIQNKDAASDSAAGLGAGPPAAWRLPTAIVLIALSTLSLYAGCLRSASTFFTDHRLMPLYILGDHFPLYPDPNKGPMLSTLYSPLSILLYAPVLLFHSVLPAFMAASLLTQGFCFIPLLVAIRISRQGRPVQLFPTLVLFAAFIFWCNLSPSMGQVYIVQSDPPALALTASSILLFVVYMRSNKSSWLVLSALCAALAPWTKQTAIPAVLVVPAVLMLQRKFRTLGLYAVLVLAADFTLLAIASPIFNFRQMLLWLIEIPARQPWKGSRFAALADSNGLLLQENLALMAVLGSAFLLRAARREPSQSGGFQEAVRQPWAICAIAGLLFWPTSVLGFVKVGAGPNTLIYSTYFFSFGLLLFAFEVLHDPVKTAGRLPQIAIAVVLALLLPNTAAMIVREFPQMTHPARNDNEEVYRFCRRWPGEVYFPDHPLSTWFAEGKAYHCNFGIRDRKVAGISIDEANFHAFLPDKMKYVAYRGAPPADTLELLPDFKGIVKDPRLPGWTLVARSQGRIQTNQ